MGLFKTTLSIGDTAPDFTLPSIKDEDVQLSALQVPANILAPR